MRFCDEDNSEDQLPIHIILGAVDYQRIRSAEPPVLGENPDTDFLAKSGQKDFENFAHWTYLA